MRSELRKALHKHNTLRPHAALNGLTPLQYILNYHHEGQSHIM